MGARLRPAADERAHKEGPVTKAEAMAAALNEFLDVSWEVEAAAVVSPDGLPMASALPPDVEEDRLAAMSASLLTLGERAAHNLNRGELAQVLVEGERGYVLLMAAGPSAVLVAVTSHDAKVGLVLFEMKKAVESIAAVMDGSFRQAGGSTPETEIAIDAAALGEPDAAADAPPAPPERIWESGSGEWRSGTAGPEPAAPDDEVPAESIAVSEVVEFDDAVAAEHPRGSDFSVPAGTGQADPSGWEPRSSPVTTEQDTPEDEGEGVTTDRESAATGWRNRLAENRSQEPAAEDTVAAEPADTDAAPSWR
jgi:uncharacterized protein